MSRLQNDVTRCLGEGATGAVCRKRESCQRYTDKGKPGDRLVYAMAMCRFTRLNASMRERFLCKNSYEFSKQAHRE